MSGFTRAQAIQGTTAIYTRSLRHVKAVFPRFWGKRVTFQDPRLKDVKPKDRIKWWNIVPGDQIRIRGDKEGALREVQSVNKITNMVYLRRGTEADDAAQMSRGEGVHYSECQLFIGRHEFPPSPGSSEPRVLPVFATRVEMTPPRWLRRKGHFLWERFAANTTPRLPDAEDDRMTIPWPKPQKKPETSPTPYDTTAEAVTAITFVKPRLPATFKEHVRKPLSEHKYINNILWGKEVDRSTPMEVYVHRELTNPHSRAKKQARWQAKKKYRAQLLEQMMKVEIKSLNGRTRRVARAEAVWKWKNRLLEEEKAEAHKKRVARGEVAQLARRKMMKARKAARIERKLLGFELKPAANQIVPKTANL